MRLKPVEPGDVLSAERHNRLIDTVNRLNPQDPDLSIGIGLFELTERLWYPAGASSSAGDTVDQTPHANASRVWLNHQTGAADTVDDGILFDVFHPRAFRDAGNFIGLPTLCSGLWVQCYHNEQAQRWEIIGLPGELKYWGRLDEELTAGGTANVSIYLGVPLADSGINVLAYAPPVLTSGSLDANASSSSGEMSGSWVRVAYYVDYDRWYVDLAEC